MRSRWSLLFCFVFTVLAMVSVQLHAPFSLVTFLVGGTCGVWFMIWLNEFARWWVKRSLQGGVRVSIQETSPQMKQTARPSEPKDYN